MKLGIVVGHEEQKPGARSEPLSDYEYNWNSDLANMLATIPSSLERKIFYRDNVGVVGAYRAADQFGADLTVELHFNSSHSQSATGTGTLYYPGSATGRRFAGILSDEIGDVLGLPDWPRGSGGAATPHQASGAERRGEFSLRVGRAPATILEPFFGSNPNDCRVAMQRKGDVAKAILRATERV